MEDLRYRSVRAQLPKSRLLEPKYKLEKIASVTGLPVEELKNAYDILKTSIDTDAWEDLVQSV